jgi:hypothetical protein
MWKDESRAAILRDALASLALLRMRLEQGEMPRRLTHARLTLVLILRSPPKTDLSKEKDCQTAGVSKDEDPSVLRAC